MKSWFRCSHKKTSLPITRRRKDAGDNNPHRLANIYVVCLNCNEQLPYSFKEGRIVEERRSRSADSPPTPQFHVLA